MEIQYIFFAGSTRAGGSRGGFRFVRKTPGRNGYVAFFGFCARFANPKGGSFGKAPKFSGGRRRQYGLREEIFRRAENSAFGRAGVNSNLIFISYIIFNIK